MDGSSPAAATPMGPSELLAHVARVRERLDLGILDADAASAALGRIHLIDTGGHAWAAGIRSRDWYRFRDGRWLPAGRPPDPTDLVTGAELLAACPACGAAGGNSRFCGECGAARPSSRLGPEAEQALADFLERGYDTLPEPLPEPRPESTPAPAPERASAPIRPPVSPQAVPASDAAEADQPRPDRPAGQGTTRRRLRSVASMVIGTGLLVMSGGRFVAGVGGLLESPVSSPAPVTDASSVPAVAGSLVPTDPPVSTDPPADASTWFADGFEAEGAWPVGDDGLSAAAYDGGWYRLQAHSTDLPAYRWAANEGTVGFILTVEADVSFETAGSMAIGLVVADAPDQNRLLVLLEPGGEWALARDDIESFATLAVGQADPVEVGTVHRLRLSLDGAGSMSAWLDGRELATAAADLEVARFGVALWSVEEAGRVAIDDYVVTVP